MALWAVSTCCAPSEWGLGCPWASLTLWWCQGGVWPRMSWLARPAASLRCRSTSARAKVGAAPTETLLQRWLLLWLDST
eukprot:772123-Lingulodinium_polyedra.AAC.1